jgi:ABC-type lipoprotein export system ATPase subunit
MLNLIGGLDRPTSGKVLIDGQEAGAMSDDDLTRLRRVKSFLERILAPRSGRKQAA